MTALLIFNTKLYFMDIFFICVGILLGLLVFIVILTLGNPQGARHIAVALLIIVGLGFILTQFFLLFDGRYNFWPFICFGGICFIILEGSRSVAFKTRTAVFSWRTGEPIGFLTAGDFKFVIPWLEYTSVSTDGAENQSISMKDLPVKIENTEKIQTATKGIQAKVKEIFFLLRPTADINQLFQIEGGTTTVIQRIREFTFQFFQDKIGEIEPVDLDTDKGTLIICLAEDLRIAINKFCLDNEYPYRIPDSNGNYYSVTIGDTELDKEYYSVLAKQEIAQLTANADNLAAEKLVDRLIKAGDLLLVGTQYTAADRLKAAQVTLGIVKEDIKLQTFGVTPDFAVLLKAIAELLKK